MDSGEEELEIDQTLLLRFKSMESTLSFHLS